MTGPNNLRERLDCLERQNRNLRRGLYVFAIVSATLFLMGAADRGDETLGNIEAKRLAITGDDGKERLVLQLEDGEPALTMLNHNGVEQVYLGINESWHDSAYLSVCSRLKNGAVDKQAVLVAAHHDTKPGNAQLVLFDRAPKQPSAADRHLMRLSSGRRDQRKPYIEIRELGTTQESELNFDILMAEPTASGQRFLLDTTPDVTVVSGVEGAAAQ